MSKTFHSHFSTHSVQVILKEKPTINMHRSQCVRFINFTFDGKTCYSPELIYTSGSIVMDVRTSITVPVILEPHGTAIIPTGLKIRMPKNLRGELRGRSGLAFEHNIVVFNGVIDQNYRNSTYVKLFNLGEGKYIIEPNERIAQLIFSEFLPIKLLLLLEAITEKAIEATEGFGSSGKI